jgi:hypothetical protein
MLRSARVPLVLIVWFGLCGCADAPHSQRPPVTEWQTGFWYWHSYRAEAARARATPDVLYFHAGKIWKREAMRYAGSDPEQWYVSQELPESLPQAREYWMVFRAEHAGVPDLSAVGALTDRINSVLVTLRRRKFKVVGVQLDIDTPTAHLPQYAAFLREVRRALPPGMELSITALLDWFRDGTAIAKVVKETDEFVPQFYDVTSAVAADDLTDWRGIGAKIDAAQWSGRFNRFGKRYRIGVSTFGRARYVPKSDAPQSGSRGVRLYSDLTPADVSGNAGFSLQTSRSKANELVLSYRPTREVRIGYNDFQPGDLIQFVLPTPESVREAVGSARRMGGQCAGVLFFRWPASNETLVMQPDDALAAAGPTRGEKKIARVDVISKHCAAVSCVDLYLTDTAAFVAKPVRYRIRSSAELEYFLPGDRMPVRMAGPSEIEVTVPPYSGGSRMLLGRAVSTAPVEFRLEERQ